MTDYSGPERRISDKVSRRKEDTFCAEHHLRWQHHEEDKTNHRTVVCGKIGHLEKGIEELEKIHAADLSRTTPWKVFVIALDLIAACLGGLFVQVDRGQEKIMGSISQVHQRISANDRMLRSQADC